MRLQIGEVIAAVRKKESTLEKQRLLHANGTPGMIALLRLNYGREPFISLPFITDPSDIPFKRNPRPANETEARLISAWKVYRIFRDPNVRKMIAEKRFIQLLEALHVDEADILIQSITGKLDMGLAENEVKAVFPDVFKGPVVLHPEEGAKAEEIDTGPAVGNEFPNNEEEKSWSPPGLAEAKAEATNEEPFLDERGMIQRPGLSPAKPKKLTKRQQAKLDRAVKQPEPKPEPVKPAEEPAIIEVPTAEQQRAAMLNLVRETEPPAYRGLTTSNIFGGDPDRK